MALLALIVAVLGGGAYWWWRVQMMRDAASGVFDLAGKAKGAVSRARFKHKAGSSVLAGVDSPGMAAATLVYSLMAMKRPLGLSDEDKIDHMLETVCRMNMKDREDAMSFAAWASGRVADTNEIVRRFMPLWQGALAGPERQQLVDMALEAAELGGAPTDAQTSVVKRLSEGLLRG
ncbi:MAG TPA: hypothetical protein VG942_00540 [Hyphomonadaceae bacterium]|nr:hypothetical protein [Hyphomonadaceae bacterium]